MKIEDNKYNNLCDELIKKLTKSEIDKIFSYEYCEYEYHFLGFLENYYDLKDLIPKDFTVVDVGCYLAIQSEYFKDHKRYIGIEPDVAPFSDANINEHFHKNENSVFIRDTAKGFVTNFSDYAKKYDLDKDKMFIICSAVPAFEETTLIEQNFPYIRIAYPGKKTIERLPEITKNMKKNNDLEIDEER